MSRSLQRMGAVLLAAAAAVVVAPAGCAVNEQSLFIHGLMDLAGSATCTAQNDPTAIERFGGLLDPSFGNGYYGLLLVGNQLVDRGIKDKNRLETSRVEIYAAEVEVQDTTGAVIAYPGPGGVTKSAAYTIPVAGFADGSTDTTTPGWGLVDVLLVDPTTAAAIRADARAKHQNSVEIVSSVKLHARSLGGEELTTTSWTFPITVCTNNCLCAQANCASGITPTASASNTTVVCFPGQDEQITCDQGITGCVDCTKNPKAPSCQ